MSAVTGSSTKIANIRSSGITGVLRPVVFRTKIAYTTTTTSSSNSSIGVNNITPSGESISHTREPWYSVARLAIKDSFTSNCRVRIS